MTNKRPAFDSLPELEPWQEEILRKIKHGYKVAAWPQRSGKSMVEAELSRRAVIHRRSGKTAMVAINEATTPEIRELMKRVFEDES